MKAQIPTTRAHLNQAIRNFFNKQGFLEVETPILTATPGMEPYLTPFETELKIPGEKITGNKVPMYLNTSPELFMKRLLSEPNLTKIYQLCKVFRNGELGGPQHNPEFTMLEWYRKNATYEDIMDDCEALIETLIGTLAETFSKAPPKNRAKKIPGEKNATATTTSTADTLKLPPPPWPRISVNELFIQFTKIDLNENRTFQKLQKAATPLDLPAKSCKTWDDLFFLIFLNKIEPKLSTYTYPTVSSQMSDKKCQTSHKEKTNILNPIFIKDYPASQAALARLKPENPFFAERFELYINGIELANAFSELTDPKEQRARLLQEQNERRALNKTVFPIDEQFLKALGKIKKPTAGIALGVDRLLMLLTGKSHIKDVLLFPQE